MKRRNGSYREVMVVGLAGLVLTLMPTGGLPSKARSAATWTRMFDFESAAPRP